MKKIISILLILILAGSQSAFAAWSFEKQSSRYDSTIDPDRLYVTAEFSNGTVTVTEEVAIFRPTTKADVREALRARAITIRERINAINRIANTVKPDVDSGILTGGE